MIKHFPFRPVALVALAFIALAFACLASCQSTKPTPPAPGPPTTATPGQPTAPPTTAAPASSDQLAPPDRTDYSGIGAGVRYRKDAAAYADAERARQGIAAPPRKVKGNGNVIAPQNSGTLTTTTAAAKNTAAAAPGAQAQAAKGADQAALAGPGATLSVASAATAGLWARWRHNIGSLVGVAAFVWLVIALIRRFNRTS